MEANNERIQDLYFLLLESSSSSSSSSNNTTSATTSNSTSTSTPTYSPSGEVRHCSSPHKALNPYKIGPDKEIFLNQENDEKEVADDETEEEVEEVVESDFVIKEEVSGILLKSLRVITDSDNVLQDAEKVLHVL